jgi:hypothetical protein
MGGRYIVIPDSVVADEVAETGDEEKSNVD